MALVNLVVVVTVQCHYYLAGYPVDNWHLGNVFIGILYRGFVSERVVSSNFLRSRPERCVKASAIPTQATPTPTPVAGKKYELHYNDVIMSAMVCLITSLTIVYTTVYSRRRSKKTSKLRDSGLCEGNSPENSPGNSRHKRPVTRNTFLFDDVIMGWSDLQLPTYARLAVVDASGCQANWVYFRCAVYDICAIGRKYKSLMSIFCFRHATSSQCHHNEELLTCCIHTMKDLG